MNRILWITLVGLVGWMVGLSAEAQTITPIAEINTVDEQGNPTFPGLSTLDRYTIEGRVLNAPGVFNGFNEDGTMDTSFILYVQDDTGGIQVYSGAWYGGGLSAYPNELHVGLLVRVTGLTGAFGGKTNINERHNPDQKFTIEVATTPPMEPEPLAINTLAGLNDFDPTRQTGGEYYQGRLVVLRNVSIVEGEWGPGAVLSVADALGNTFAVELRAGTGIGETPQPAGPMHIVGVFDQEDPEPPFTEGYVLWPRSIDDFQSAGGSSHIESWDVYK